jgi:tRNA nucleotidyltransferase/poly(A) polymerase
LINLPHEIQKILPFLEGSEQYYLVGGAVRDSLLSKTSQDLDIVCSGDTRIIARKLADRVSGAFYMLDEERNACRVITQDQAGERLVFDFTQLRGNSIDEDLTERDFTINAMAIDLAGPVEIIDPLQGKRDLVEKWLRTCKVSSFIDDPLRAIRAVRYSVKYGLQIEAQTVDLLTESIEKLTGVSRERKRDELFKILDNEKPWLGMEMLNHFGMLTYFAMAEIPDIRKAFSRLKIFFVLSSLLSNKLILPEDELSFSSSFDTLFEGSRGQLCDHLEEVNQSDRSKKSLDALSALLWEIGPADINKVVAELALSKEEEIHLFTILEHRMDVFEAVNKELSNRSIYQYYRPKGSRGVDLALLSMVDYASSHAFEKNEDQRVLLFGTCQKLINTWFNRPEIVNPKLLLNGRELMFEFDLLQGPSIGRILDGLKEEQAAGEIQTRQEALNWVEGKLQSGIFNKSSI